MSSIDITAPTATRRELVDQAQHLMSELKKVSTRDDNEPTVQSATILGSEVEDMITDMHIRLKNVFFSPENQDRSLMTEEEYLSKNAAIRYIDSCVDRSYAQWDNSLMDTFKKMNLIDDASAQKSTEERAALKIAETLKTITSEDVSAETKQSPNPPSFIKPVEPPMEKAVPRPLDVDNVFSPPSIMPPAPVAAAAGGAKKTTVTYKGKEYPVMEEERVDKKKDTTVVKKYILIDNKKRYLKKT